MSDAHVLTVTRDVAAPASRVWAAWTDPASIARWWGPAGFHSTVVALDVREGGRFEVIMHGPDGTDYPNLYLFDRVDVGRQLVYTNVGSERFGLAPFQSVFDIEELGSATRIVLTARFSSAEDHRRHVEDFHAVEGARQLLERLEAQARAASRRERAPPPSPHPGIFR
jgi:uncharacterized protein YndB with AHSA1/START domain